MTSKNDYVEMYLTNDAGMLKNEIKIKWGKAEKC